MTTMPTGAQDRIDEFYECLTRGNIPGLDGVRALAVLLVIISHFGIEQVNGALGVMMFFVMSGFLITWLLLKEDEKTGEVSLKNFYSRRVLRIFPAFYVFWVIGVAIFLVRGHGIDWGEAFSAFFYVSNYYYGMDWGPGNGDLFSHTWSLCIEEQFYLLWPLMFLKMKHNLRRLAWFLVTIIGLTWVYRSILLFGFEVRQEYLYRAFDTRLDHLMIGCLMAVALKNRSLDKLLGILTASMWYPLALLVVIFFSQTLHDSVAYTFSIGYAVEPVLIALFLLSLIYFADRGYWRVFQHPVTRYLGRISYPLYLWQQLTLFTAKRLTAEYAIAIQLAFAILVTVAFASGSYFLVEKPFLALKNRWR